MNTENYGLQLINILERLDKMPFAFLKSEFGDCCDYSGFGGGCTEVWLDENPSISYCIQAGSDGFSGLKLKKGFVALRYAGGIRTESVNRHVSDEQLIILEDIVDGMEKSYREWTGHAEMPIGAVSG